MHVAQGKCDVAQECAVNIEVRKVPLPRFLVINGLIREKYGGTRQLMRTNRTLELMKDSLSFFRVVHNLPEEEVEVPKCRIVDKAAKFHQWQLDW